MPAGPLLEFRHLTKAFDATVAVDDVSFSVEPGEVCALLGANGAGKSTLIKLLAGVHQPDDGAVLVDGRPASAGSGVAFIHQDLGLIEKLTVAENIAMTQGYATRRGLIDWAAVRAAAGEALASVGAEIPVDVEVASLSRADQSVVAIARAISADCRAIVLDEPTASLTETDAKRLFSNIRRLRAHGVSVIYVTHRLDEVFQIADRVVVLRDGRLVAERAVADVKPDELVELIVGGVPLVHARELAARSDSVALRLRGVVLSDGAAPLDIELRAGEILGIAGLRGAGQEPLGRGIAAIDGLSVQTGAVDGRELSGRSLRKALGERVGFVTSRRELEGLAMTMTVRENLFLNPRISGRRTASLLSPRPERASAKRVGASLALHPNRPELPAGTLSGGNQQKVVLGRWLAVDRSAIVLEEPTMGIDVGARADIYALIAQEAERGVGFVVVSSNFEELAILCHRVVVIDRGAAVAELSGSDVTVAGITHAASGGESARAERALQA